MLINCSNHPSAAWSSAQRQAALRAYGSVQDYPFPAVDPSWDETHLSQMAAILCAEITAMQPDAVLCQGEMGLCFALVSTLQQKGIPVVHACSERCVREKQTPDGSTVKLSEFIFRGFRRYPAAENLNISPPFQHIH